MGDRKRNQDLKFNFRAWEVPRCIDQMGWVAWASLKIEFLSLRKTDGQS